MKQLWAPWRLEYIQGADEEQGCVFCRALEADDETGLVVHRGERAFVVLNKFPYASGHLMVAPNRHEGEFGKLHGEEAGEIHRLVPLADAALLSGLDLLSVANETDQRRPHSCGSVTTWPRNL